MKLQNELEFAVNKVNETIKRNGLEKVREYMANVYAGHEWKNFNVRISCDIVKGSIGSRVICEWYDKYNCTDEHITTLCIAAMKAAGLLPFNPSGVALENNPHDERAAMKSETIRRAEWLHSVGRYSDAVRITRATGVISDEQTRREKAHAEALECTIKKAATLNPAAVAALTDDELNALHDELRAALSELYEGEDSAAIKLVKAPYTFTREEVARRRNEANTPAALYNVTFSDGTTWAGVLFAVAVEDKLLGGFQCGQEYFQTIGEAVAFVRELYPRTPFHVNAIRRAEAVAETSGAKLRTVYARQRVGRRLEVIEYPVTLTECHEAEKAPTTDEKAPEGVTPRHDVGDALECHETGTTADELNREALAVVEKIQKSPRLVCLFDLCTELYEVKTKAEADGLHKWQALTACGVYREGRDTLATIARMITGDDEAEAPAPSCYSQSEKLGESGSQKSPLYSVAEKVGKVAHAAAFFLLSLTIGTSHEAAEIVTNDPAAVFAQVAEAGETLTAFALEEIPAPDELPAADVPALL